MNLTQQSHPHLFTGPNIASNWQLSVISRISSGAPLTISSGTDRALTGLGGQTADQLMEDIFQDEDGRRVGDQRYNRAAFAAPALGTYGNMGLFSVRGFAAWSLDGAQTRHFGIREGQRMEVRAEAFNLTNSVRPNDPNATITNANFGRITSVQAPRIMQFALKYVF